MKKFKNYSELKNAAVKALYDEKQRDVEYLEQLKHGIEQIEVILGSDRPDKETPIRLELVNMLQCIENLNDDLNMHFKIAGYVCELAFGSIENVRMENAFLETINEAWSNE